MIFLQKPADFKPKMQVSACFILYEKEFVFLKTGKHKKYAGLWGIPAGKIKEGESPKECIKREIKEETQLELGEEQILPFKTVYIRYPDIDYDYHMYYSILTEKPIITIDPNESEEYAWVEKKSALMMPLIPDEGPCLELFFKEVKK